MADPLPLRFDWPDGLVLDVHWTRTEWQVRDDGDRMEWAATGRFTLTTERLDGPETSWAIHVGPQQREVTAHAEVEPGAFDRKAVVNQLKDAFCSFVVDHRGQAAVLLDGAAVREQLGPPDDVRQARPDLAAFFDRMTTDPALLQQATELWDPIVGTWAGKALAPGVAVSSTHPKPLPILANNPVNLESELFLELAGDGQAVLHSHATFDPDHLRQVSDAVSARGTGNQVVDAELESAIRLVTRPDGLIPVEVTALARHKVGLQDPSGVIRRMRGEERRVWSFKVIGR